MLHANCIVILLILLLSVLPAQAELRQWTDENGVKHFSNKKELPAAATVERSFEEKESRPVEQRFPRTVQPKSNTLQPKPTASQQKPEALEQKTVREKIRIREARLKEVFDRIYVKRRYVKRQGKTDIERIRRLNGEIADLEKSGREDQGHLEQLKAERAAAKKRLFNENLRTRKGVGEDIQEYKEIETEIEALKKQL